MPVFGLSSALWLWSPAAAAESPGSSKMRFTAAEHSDYDGPPLLLAKNRRVKVGGYGGMGGAYTRFMGRDSGLVSMEGALLFDHRLSLGLAGYGFTRTPRGPDGLNGERQELGAGYGGLAIRYSLFSNWPVYGTFGAVVGGGVVNLHPDYGWDDEHDWDHGWDHDDEWEHGRFDAFLVVQPEATLNANVTRWLRLGATVGYRFTSGVGRFGLGEGDLNGVVLGGNIQLGWF